MCWNSRMYQILSFRIFKDFKIDYTENGALIAVKSCRITKTIKKKKTNNNKISVKNHLGFQFNLRWLSSALSKILLFNLLWNPFKDCSLFVSIFICHFLFIFFFKMALFPWEWEWEWYLFIIHRSTVPKRVEKTKYVDDFHFQCSSIEAIDWIKPYVNVDWIISKINNSTCLSLSHLCFFLNLKIGNRLT